MTTVSVVVPSFRRGADLERCLRALAAQSTPATEVLVVLRAEDGPSREVVERSACGATVVLVERPGQVAALNRGCDAARGELIAITDDDARPRPRWIEAIVARFAEDAAIGAVGGRDVVHFAGREEGCDAETVGRVRWWGARVGDHHCRSGLQDVDFLKGANMTLRASARRPFDEHLHGAGAQVCNDLEVTWSIRRRGWRVVWDPEVVVDHHIAHRHDERRGDAPTLEAERAAQHNEVWSLLLHAPWWQVPLLASYVLLIGSNQAPGLILAALRRGSISRYRLKTLTEARLSAMRAVSARLRSRQTP